MLVRGESRENTKYSKASALAVLMTCDCESLESIFFNK